MCDFTYVLKGFLAAEGKLEGAGAVGTDQGAERASRRPGLGHVRTHGNRRLNVGCVLETIQAELNVGSVNLSDKNFTYTVVFKECMLTKYLIYSIQFYLEVTSKLF